MRITIRRDKSDDWQVIDSVDFEREHELQDLLHESPSLIPLGQIAPGTPTPVFAVAELGLPGSGNTDIVAFSEDGSISIVECKLAKNAEIRRKVIGQILEYAAFLWEMSYEELDERVQRQADGPLAEVMARSVADEDWDEEAFRQAVGRNLRDGQFILVIAVDEINEHLSEILRYLNQCSEAAFSLCAMEVNLFASEDLEILMPRLHGPSIEKKRRSGSSQASPALLHEVARLWNASQAEMRTYLRRHYLQFHSPHYPTQIHFEISVKSDHIKLALDFETKDKKLNHQAARSVLEREDEIRQAIGEGVESSVKPSSGKCRVFLRRYYNPDDTGEAEMALTDMKKFIQVMEPHLERALTAVGGIEED